ncbi:MAG: hypothetical protein AAGH42_06105 [Pseudomonadota bacterium]
MPLQGIAATLAANRIGSGYGALAAGADILIAEALLAHGAALHVILPCTAELFKSISVDPFGGDWPARFDHCLASAASVRFATDDRSLSCHRALDLASTMAMGMAIEEADLHCTKALQITAAAGGGAGAADPRLSIDMGCCRAGEFSSGVGTGPRRPAARRGYPRTEPVYGGNAVC